MKKLEKGLGLWTNGKSYMPGENCKEIWKTDIEDGFIIVI